MQPLPDAVHNKHYPNDKDRYDIEKILMKHTHHLGCARQLYTEYLVRWKAFDESHNKWKRAEDLEGVQELVDEFEATG